jgi:hypothetical protein
MPLAARKSMHQVGMIMAHGGLLDKIVVRKGIFPAPIIRDSASTEYLL